MAGPATPGAPAADQIEFERTLGEALAVGDDHALFELVGRQVDERAAYQALSDEVSRLSSRHRGRPTFSELLFIPVIERRRGSLIGNVEAWAAAERCVGELLDEWLPREVRRTIFRGIRPYEWVASWHPSMLRRHLHAAMPGSAANTCKFLTEEMWLPREAPRLGFILLALTSGNGWPQLPPPDTLRDVRFQTVLAHALNGVSAQEPPLVLAPDQMPFAIADGLCLWLSMLHEHAPITSWALTVGNRSSEAVCLSLRLQVQDEGCVELSLRKYQIAHVGIDSVASILNGIAHPDSLAVRQ